MQSVDPPRTIGIDAEFGNIWEQNPGNSLDRTPLPVRDHMHYTTTSIGF